MAQVIDNITKLGDDHIVDLIDGSKSIQIQIDQKGQYCHFVLIHGICGGAWNWYKIKSLLEISGHKATCLDLRGSGIDPTDSNSVLSFDDYNSPLDHFMAALPEDQKVVLVGHSAGGLSVTNATYKYPNKVQGAVYVAATMLEFGYQSSEDLRIGAPDLSKLGDIFEFEYAIDGDKPPITALFKTEFLHKLVYPMSPLEDYTLASMLSRPGPLRAITSAKFTRLVLEEKNNIKNIDVSADENKNKIIIPHVYIKTRQDKLINKEQQEAMIEKWKPSEVYEMDTDHTPFFSNPFLLFGLLLKASHVFTSRSRV